MIAKGRRSFELKKQTLTVGETTACVKADKALTLFMMNTLVENARKYNAGRWKSEPFRQKKHPTMWRLPWKITDRVFRKRTVCVSWERKCTILEPSVWILPRIRQSCNDRRGMVFGLMNCKGIIEKYRKTNSLFAVCRFDIQSTPGKGSRFSFRLPKGARRMVGLLWIGCACCWEWPVLLNRSLPRIRSTMKRWLRMTVCWPLPMTMPIGCMSAM